MDKTERHLNLIAMLMEARTPVARDRIRDALYSDQSEEAFQRMFERDKAELRNLGLSVDVVDIGAWDQGYVIRREEATIGDLGLSPAEHAALMLAAQMWGDGTFGQASPQLAGLKLAAVTGEQAPVPWILPHLDLASPNMAVITEAIESRSAITFLYRAAGALDSAVRILEPHGIRFRRAWYVAGFDRTRGEARMFKLDRIEGEVAIMRGVDARFVGEATGSSALEFSAGEEIKAVVGVSQEIAWWVERGPGVRRTGTAPDGRVLLEVSVSDQQRFVRWLAGFSDSAEVLEPADLRAACIEHLRSVAAGN